MTLMLFRRVDMDTTDALEVGVHGYNRCSLGGWAWIKLMLFRGWAWIQQLLFSGMGMDTTDALQGGGY